MKKTVWFMGLIALAVLTVAACKTLETATTLATTVGVGAGVISPSQGKSIQRSTMAVARSVESFTPEQEYYIGRSVGAVVLSKYPAYANTQVNQYINVIGQTLAKASDLPELFNGYHFLVLDSDDINAFATPGGHIFITRGLIRCSRTEDALAAVLAHEVAHIQLRHGMQAIEKARVTEALTVLTQEGLKTYGSREIAQLTQTFSGAISDITSTLINNGYSRSFEYQADQSAMIILRRVGYNPAALMGMLGVMEQNLKPGGLDFAKTHPAPKDRIEEIQKSDLKYTSTVPPRIRQERFIKAVGQL
jgi:predicted Zn-dependent protease